MVRVVAAEAATRFGVSEDTIRRDLRALAGQGLAVRVHGGALLAQSEADRLLEGVDNHQPASDRVTSAMARHADTADVVVIDSGAAGLRVAERLDPHTRPLVVTSSPAVGAAASSRGCRVLMLCGIVNRTVSGSVDGQAVDALRSVRADIAILGSCSIHSDVGISIDDPEPLVFKMTLIDVASEVVVAVPPDRIEATAPFVVAGTSRLSKIFVEAPIRAEVASKYADANVQVIVS